MTKIRIYGLDGQNNVVKTGWVWNSVSDELLDMTARIWKADYGCVRVYAMADSKGLRDAWFDYVRAYDKHDGRFEFERFEFVDYLESGDWELAAA